MKTETEIELENYKYENQKFVGTKELVNYLMKYLNNMPHDYKLGTVSIKHIMDDEKFPTGVIHFEYDGKNGNHYGMKYVYVDESDPNILIVNLIDDAISKLQNRNVYPDVLIVNTEEFNWVKNTSAYNGDGYLYGIPLFGINEYGSIEGLVVILSLNCPPGSIFIANVNDNLKSMGQFALEGYFDNVLHAFDEKEPSLVIEKRFIEEIKL